jgi:iron(III) transport system substrate-binding protein
MVELTNPAWKARISMANPGFGTTSTHFHVLRQHWGETNWLAWCQAFVRNHPFLEEGNSHVVQRVARGEALIGLTDSDDISAAQREGSKVRSLGEPIESFSIPNTIAGIRNAPHPEAAAALIAYLRSPKVELQLIEAGGLEPNSDKTNRQGLHPRWETLVSDLEVANRQLEQVFRR